MFSLTLVTCVFGVLCETETAPISYMSADRCHSQAAIIAGIARANTSDFAGDLTWTATCTNDFDQSVSVTEGEVEISSLED